MVWCGSWRPTSVELALDDATHRGRRHHDDHPADGTDAGRGERPGSARVAGPAATTDRARSRRARRRARRLPRALDALDEGRHVLVAAPTGSGKTLVAEYAIDRARARRQGLLHDAAQGAVEPEVRRSRRGYGADRVGLLTGDNSINGDAPIVVMTTEVLRNMIYAASPTLDGLGVVVLDEVHYLQDRYRGPVWEEVIVHLARVGRLVCLSATVSNAEEVAEWIETVRGATAAVIEERRPVELRTCTWSASGRTTAAPAADVRRRIGASPTRGGAARRGGPGRRGRPGPRVADAGCARRAGRDGRAARLEGMLPAIVFVFSRAGCDQAVEQCVAAGLRLTGPDERRRDPRDRRGAHSRADDDDLDVLGYARGSRGSRPGFAAHHAGMVPPMKEAVEEAFAAGLVKVVFATETLALGINMPARSVVIEKLTKFTGERHEFLTPGEYTQLTGPGRPPGIDDRRVRGRALEPVRAVRAGGRARRRAGRSTCVGVPADVQHGRQPRALVHGDEAHHLLNLSFAQFQADRDVVRSNARLERSREELLAARGGRQRLRRRRRVPRLRSEQPSARAGTDGGAASIGARGAAARRRGHLAPPGGLAVLATTNAEAGSWPARPHGVDRPARGSRLRRTAAGGDDRASDALRHRPQPSSAAGWPAPAHGLRLDDATADGRAAAQGSPRREHPLDRRPGLARGGCRRRGRPHRARRPTRAASVAAEARAWPASSTVCSGARGVGLPRGVVAHAARRASRPPLHRDRPAGGRGARRGAARRPRPAELARLVSCFTYERRGPEGEARCRPPWPSKTVARSGAAIDRVGAT